MNSDPFSASERERINALKWDMLSACSRIAIDANLTSSAPEDNVLSSSYGLGSKRPREQIGGTNRPIDDVMSTALSIINTAKNDSEEDRKRDEAQARELSMQRHQPWKIKKVMLDHHGWVRCVAIDPSNEWFATGGVDTIIKVWDLATGKLKQNFTGHKEPVRGIAISSTSPYMFSASDDRSVKCWDLETNRIIRDYHGHGGSANTIAIHPELDVIVTGSRDKSIKLWDVRSRQCIHTMQGHKDAVMTVVAQSSEPQVMSGSSDSLIYLWDIRNGKPITNLTRHKKPVEMLVAHKTEDTFVSIGSDNIRKWKLPLGVFYTNMHHDTVPGAQAEGPWCCGALSPWGELCVGGRDGTLRFYDWSTNILLQQTSTKGFQSTEKGILCCAFDVSGKRLITGEVDKTVKIWEPKSSA